MIVGIAMKIGMFGIARKFYKWLFDACPNNLFKELDPCSFNHNC